MRIALEGDDRQTLIARLGLSSDASNADIQQAVTARILAEANPAPDPDPTPDPEPDPAPDPAPEPDPEPDDSEDVVHVDAAAYRQLTTRASKADQLAEDARIKERDDLIEGAVRVGKFPPSRRDHYKARFDSDAKATKRDIDRMAKNVVPLEERGKDVSEEDLAAKSDAYPPEWLPERQPQAGSNGTGGAEPPRRQNRVHAED